jgi:ankyrin repeat protein
MYACFHGHADAVRTLINAGADTSLRNSAGRTALYLAQSNNHVDVVNVLIKGPNIMVIH